MLSYRPFCSATFSTTPGTCHEHCVHFVDCAVPECRLGRVMDEKIEAQDVLRETVRKVTSTKRALGNSEHESHERIDGMMRYIQDFLGDTMDVEPQARSCRLPQPQSCV